MCFIKRFYFLDLKMGDPLNLSSILSEMMDVNDVVGCGFGDRNGLTLVLEGQISR